MTAADDGTLDLLTAHEARFITVLGRNTVTPQALAGQLTWTWQMVSRMAGQLKRIGLVSIESMPKQTRYQLTADGERLLPLIRERTTASGRFLTGEDLNGLAAEAERGYCTDWVAGSHPHRCLIPLRADGSCPNAEWHLEDQAEAEQGYPGA